MRPSRVLATMLGCGLLALVAQAQVPRDFRRVVALMQPEARERLQAQAARWAGWSPAERQAFARRAADWQERPLDERRARREAWHAWRQLDGGEHARLRQESARLAGRPAAELAELRTRFAALDASLQRGWLLGPALGADYGRLQPLLAQLPAEQHADLLRTLRRMTPLQRADLGVLVQRTPPAERDRLRRDLLSTSDSNRAAWLQLRLEQ